MDIWQERFDIPDAESRPLQRPLKGRKGIMWRRVQEPSWGDIYIDQSSDPGRYSRGLYRQFFLVVSSESRRWIVGLGREMAVASPDGRVLRTEGPRRTS